MISCAEYDYIEIACMFRYPIKLTTKSGVIVEGIAVDTGRNEQREECIKVDVNGAEHLVVLADLSTLEACIENPHFDVVSFESG